MNTCCSGPTQLNLKFEISNLRLSCVAPWLKLSSSFVAQRRYRIDARSSPGGKEASRQRDENQQKRHAGKCQRIRRAHAEELAREQVCRCARSRDPGDNAGCRWKYAYR